ncbi:MAG: hypothetical protein WBM69_17385 [Desulfobacterales bacterium]
MPSSLVSFLRFSHGIFDGVHGFGCRFVALPAAEGVSQNIETLFGLDLFNIIPNGILENRLFGCS